jgi:hypothetical protein
MTGYTTEELVALVFAEHLPQHFIDRVELSYYRKNHPEKNLLPPVTPVEPEESAQLELVFD